MTAVETAGELARARQCDTAMLKRNPTLAARRYGCRVAAQRDAPGGE
jgi:hypothetical protein